MLYSVDAQRTSAQSLCKVAMVGNQCASPASPEVSSSSPRVVESRDSGCNERRLEFDNLRLEGHSGIADTDGAVET